MKKLFLFGLLAFGTSATFAQLNKGQWLAGGNASFSSTKSEIASITSKSTTVEISPDAGYFIADKLAAGIRGSYFRNQFSNSEFKVSNYGAGPFVRYYFLPKAQKANLFADASYLFNGSKEAFQNTVKSRSGSYVLQAGPSVFLNQHVALEFSLGYMHTKQKESGAKSNTLQTGVGFKIHLGKGKP